MSSRSPLVFARHLPDRLSNNATEFGKGNVVLAWELSSTLDTGFCLTALNRALEQTQPSMFNTDQGAQFTSTEFTGALANRAIRISMDGRFRCTRDASPSSERLNH